jgi:cytochrome c-type biogenesis protein CcmH
MRRGRLTFGAASRRLALALVLHLLAASLFLPAEVQADPIDDQVRQVAKQLRCPICESVSVADSPAELAVQMRGVIRKKLEAGESEQQIVDYFVAAYGDSVLLEPPRRGLGWFVWLAPIAALALGAFVVAVLLRGWVRSSREPNLLGRRSASLADLDDASADGPTARARQELEAMRQGGER